jgi:protein-disulfide isomerase
MNKRSIVIITLCLALLGFGAAWYLYSQPAAERRSSAAPAPAADTSGSQLVRFSSPVLGPADARTTIVEFFDPACEACRAFYPIVKEIITKHNGKVRVVLRYTPLHDGSEQVVRILETARLQGIFQPVLEALLMAQPQWASHDAPNLDKAWQIARTAGLDVELAQREMAGPAIDATIQQDIADGKAFGVRQTPTFFVNGNSLVNFGPEQLKELVQREVAAAS